MITMMLIDDEYLVLKGIKETINWEQYGIEIIGEALNGQIGFELVKKLNPDIILTDIRMPIMDGLKLMEHLKAYKSNSSIIVLSGFEDFEYARCAIKNGAVGYLLKPIDNDQLIETVQTVSQNILKERKLNQYIETLTNELPSITKQFLLDLTSGDLTDINLIKEKASFLNVPININDCFISVIKIDDYALSLNKLPPEQLKIWKKAVANTISQAFLNDDRYQNIIVNKTEEEFVVFIHSELDDKCTLEYILSSCSNVVNKLKAELHQNVSIGVSNKCTDISVISKTYNEAFTASQYKFVAGSSSVSQIQDIGSLNYRREIRDSISYIKGNYSKDITVESAAKELFISSSHLMHLFKKELGKTFNECLTDYRISVAKKLLLDPKLKIYEVSSQIGYTDVKYFSQLFKKNTGKTPSEYIKTQA